MDWRIKKTGFKLIVFPDAIIYYYPKRSSLKLLSKRMINYGTWMTINTKKYSDYFKTKFLIPFIMVISIASLSILIFFYPLLLANVILLGLIIYLIIILIGSLYLSIKHSIKYFMISAMSYAVEQFSIGLGFLGGILKKLPNTQIRCNDSWLM